MNGGPSAPDWYYSKAGAPAGQQAGPFAWDQLVSLAQAGAIVPADLVWNPSLPQWLPAAQVPGLLPVAPPVALHQPHPGQPAAPVKGGGSSWLAWVIPLAALVIAAAGLGVYFGLFHDKDGDDSAASTVASRTTTTTTTETTTTTSVAPTTTTAPPTTTTTVPPTAVWTNLNPSGEVPPAADSQFMVYTSNTGKMVLFGGWTYVDTFGDTWAYDPAANTWADLKPTGAAPPARANHRMVYDPDAGKIILFGGVADYSNQKAFNDTWAYDPAANAWTDLHPAGQVPSARRVHSMAYDTAARRVILFGGWDGTTYLGDTWIYDPAVNTWARLSPTGAVPSPRGGSPMVYDPVAGKTIIFGGAGDNELFNETWAFDAGANTWTNLDPTGSLPSARASAAMVYDPQTGRVLMFGGIDYDGVLNDTWAYDPAANTWTNLDPAGVLPPARSNCPVAYDTNGQKMVLFGGFKGDSSFNDTWAFSSQGTAAGAAGGPGTQGNPLPLGDQARVGDWIVKVVGATLDGTQAVLENNSLSPTPDPGSQYVLVKLEATYMGTGPGKVWIDIGCTFVGSKGSEFLASWDAVPPEALFLADEVASGGTVSGNVPFMVDSDQVSGGLIMVEVPGLPEDTSTYLAIE